MQSLSRTAFPPGGWYFYEPLTGWKTPTPVNSTFDQTVQQIIKMRYQNPAKRLTTDIYEVGEELEKFTRARLGMPTGSDLDLTKSILEQSTWSCGLFDFARAQVQPHGECYLYNCTLAARPEGDWLIARRDQFDIEVGHDMNDLIVFDLKDTTVGGGSTLELPGSGLGEQFEDPRGFYHDGAVYLSCVNYLRNRSQPHQTLFEIRTKNLDCRRLDLVYGGNGPSVMGNTKWEKNWLWFFHVGQLHMIYETYPHRVVAVDNGKPGQAFVTDRIGQWPYGQPRGGTPPILVDDLYFTFFHSASDEYGIRRYYMGALAFEAQEPFTIRRITPKPILRGNRKDRARAGKPLVVFPCGSLLRNGEWLVTLGLNDADCAWIKIPHAELLQHMTPT